MSVGDMISRLAPEKASPAEENARLQAEADTALAAAEYEFYAMQEELQAALAVPLRDRAIKTGPDAADPARAEGDAKPAERLSLAARIASAAAA